MQPPSQSERKIAGPTDSYGYLLYHAALKWQRALTAELQPFELTCAQFFLLGSLGWLMKTMAAAPKQRELAEHAGLDPMMTSQVLRTLEGRGLVERAIDPKDARARRLSMTPKGTELFKKALSRVHAVDRSFFGPLGEKGGASFKAALEKVGQL